MTLFQFVCFDTPLLRASFLSGWAPYASSFLSRGLERLILSERIGAGGFAFVSRNAWPADRFAETFRGQLPSDAGGGPVRAVQGGAFRLVDGNGFDPLVANLAQPKLVAFLESASAIAQWSALVRTLPSQGAWAHYERAPNVRGGRFEAVFELFAAPSPQLDALGSATSMREVLSLP